MKNVIKSIVLCTSLLAVLSACSPEKNKETVKVQLSVNAQMQADELTDAGEQLIAPHTIHLADRAFALALEKNPNDKKAQFYRALLKRFMVFRGIATNIRPMIEKHGDVKAFDKQMAKFPKSPLADFVIVPEGKEAKPMLKEEDVQNLLIAYREALQDFRTFITTNADLKLDLRLNPVMFMNAIQENMTSNCVVVPGTAEEDGNLECDATDAAVTRVNVADLMVLKQMAAGEILYLSFYTSYNLNGAFNYATALDGKELTGKQKQDLAFEKMDLKLLKKQGFSAIRSLGADLGVAAKWAMKYQDSICPKNSNGGPAKRKGYMFAQGLCVEDSTLVERNLAILEQVLKGTMAISLGSEESTTKIVKNVNFLAPFNRPAADFRNLGVATWNDEGTKATSLRDKTLGGMFPDGDAEFFIRTSN